MRDYEWYKQRGREAHAQGREVQMEPCKSWQRKAFVAGYIEARNKTIRKWISGGEHQ